MTKLASLETVSAVKERKIEKEEQQSNMDDYYLLLFRFFSF